ncbi:MAG: redoxin domain-containing protein [Flavobacterium sp.]|nr:MAG: redoxin domain-containing protein [Flavobacterium sp.]
MKNVVKLKRLFVVLAIFAASLSGYSQAEPKPLETFTKDEITVKSYNYETFKALLEKNNDSTYVVNFWATWCAPCIAELPNFEKLNAQYKDKKVSVLLVSLDFKKQVEKSLIPFIKRRNLKSKVVFLSDPDMNSWISKVNPDWTGAIPATVIYKGNQRKFYEQSFTYEQLETEVKPFIQ